jgi:hypothetical protein
MENIYLERGHTFMKIPHSDPAVNPVPYPKAYRYVTVITGEVQVVHVSKIFLFWFRGWSAEDWFSQYSDLPNKLLKVHKILLA